MRCGEWGALTIYPGSVLINSGLGGIRSVRDRPPQSSLSHGGPLRLMCVGATEPRIFRLTTPCLGRTLVLLVPMLLSLSLISHSASSAMMLTPRGCCCCALSIVAGVCVYFLWLWLGKVNHLCCTCCTITRRVEVMRTFPAVCTMETFPRNCSTLQTSPHRINTPPTHRTPHNAHHTPHTR